MLHFLELMYKHGLDYHKVGTIQGFLTDDDQFVDRYDAAQMAFRSGQMLKNSDIYKKMSKDTEHINAYPLYSEDLW